MSGLFPKKLLETINQTPEGALYRFESCFVQLYACRSVREFNAYLASAITFFHEGHGFYMMEHGDWIHAGAWQEVQLDGKITVEQPLSSFLLKDPVGMLPTEKELEEEYLWRKSIACLYPKGKVQDLEIDDLHLSYLVLACRQMCAYQKLLKAWVDVGKPMYDEQCLSENMRQKKRLKENLKVQRIRILDLKKHLELLYKTAAPGFMISLVAGQSLREKRIIDQMHEVIRMC